MSTQAIPEQFTGYAAVNEEEGKALNLTKIQYTPKKWTEADVDIKISHCGICGSCIHTLTNGWPSPTSYPCVAGHEVVGTVVRAGKASGHSIGERVGVGAQGGSCGECDMCQINKENYCAEGMRGTYQGRYPEDPENYAQGGYADYIRCQGRFAIAIPEQIKSAEAAPLMCAGATVYSPLKRFGAGPGKRVAVVGIGGLGHLALQFSNALGAETFALSHSDSKLTDAEKLGVKPENFIITKDETATAKKWARSFDLIVCTAFQDDMPIESLFLKLLRPEGTLALCGLPESKLPAMYGQAFVGKGVALAGTLIAGTTQIKEMLDVAAEKNVRPWIQVRPMSDASQAVKDMDKGKARYRYVLEN
ncbi:hypothetical protein MVLG_01186 [Microbotryum lychnidis-dioicae p1A1 Lamole]|uniref:Enoyl reductase (ER) domain-containing protein n=1 Tax=Microbotryum lychnidis-dioicae (strain p1A1 Lamole / MvSl-1064) TaxID=683840 RepID=U5H1C8_USTV1|nr:hypothetical protein MVLG_01186 [Microbotryum lychnidis-dioicae p1A1 Lamole]|eukprot:KDE08731.1 hypothetical protein MVLG_01186 [Microbotryum lychnidis-dioicae p1A1 Lamole]